MSDKELKPCPFCGGKARIIGTGNKISTKHNSYCALCECGVNSRWFHTTIEVKQQWNTRATEAKNVS